MADISKLDFGDNVERDVKDAYVRSLIPASADPASNMLATMADVGGGGGGFNPTLISDFTSTDFSFSVEGKHDRYLLIILSTFYTGSYQTTVCCAPSAIIDIETIIRDKELHNASTEIPLFIYRSNAISNNSISIGYNANNDALTVYCGNKSVKVYMI